MKIDTITIIASGALLALALVVLYAGYLRRRHHVRRLLVTDLLRDYFRGHMPAPQLKRRTREIASQHFTSSDEFYALAVSAFQGAADSALAPQAQSKQSQRKLLNAMANLKQEFGLTDRYQIEAWRPGRE
jgi:hypothetical protein